MLQRGMLCWHLKQKCLLNFSFRTVGREIPRSSDGIHAIDVSQSMPPKTTNWNSKASKFGVEVRGYLKPQSIPIGTIHKNGHFFIAIPYILPKSTGTPGPDMSSWKYSTPPAPHVLEGLKSFNYFFKTHWSDINDFLWTDSRINVGLKTCVLKWCQLYQFLDNLQSVRCSINNINWQWIFLLFRSRV